MIEALVLMGVGAALTRTVLWPVIGRLEQRARAAERQRAREIAAEIVRQLKLKETE